MKPFVLRLGALAAGALAGTLALAASGTALAANPGTQNGGIAGGVYAGNGAPSLNGNTDKAISQYDVACFQVSQH